MDNLSISNPHLMKYLQGEISFETWLEQQGSKETLDAVQTRTEKSLITDSTAEESSSVFSSWGNAFTSSGAAADEAILQNKTVREDDDSDDYEEEEEEDEGTEEEILQLGGAGRCERNVPHSKQDFISFDVHLPTFEGLPETSVFAPVTNTATSSSAAVTTVTWRELKPIIEELAMIIPTSTINKRRSKLRKRRITEDSSAENNIPDIVKDFQDFQLRKRGNKRTPANLNKLPELLRLQMGQANLLVAKQDFKQAASICMEIVREAPYSGLPFKTLAFIYDEQGDKEMALQYSLIYAYLDCRDSHEWMELARKCREAGNIKQEMACCDKACKYKPCDIELQWERNLKYFSYGEYRKCLDIYFQIHKRIIPVDRITYMSCGKRIAKLYHKLGLKDKVQYTLQLAFETCTVVQDFEAINILCDIYIENKDFLSAIELMCAQCGVKIPNAILDNVRALSQSTNADLNNFLHQSMTSETFKEDTSEIASNIANKIEGETLNIMQNFNTASATNAALSASTVKTYATLEPKSNQTEYYCPDHLPVDLRVKLAQCLIYCNQLDYIEDIVLPLFSETIDDVGDLVLDLGEAYFEIGQYREALKYIVEVIASEKYNQAAVWLKLAEIYSLLGETNQSIDAYYQVLHLAPLQVSIRLALASALKSVGRDEEALTVLSEYDGTRVNEDGEEQESLNEANRLKVEEYQDWYDKCMAMYTNHQLKEFIFHGYILMHNYLMSSFGHQKKQTVSKVHMWEMFLKILNVCVKIKEFKKAITLLEKALLYKPYSESRKYRLDLDYLLTTTYFLAGEYSKAFDMFRVIMMHETDENINKNSMWNLFTQIVNKMLDKRHHRFSLRLLFKRPNHVPLIIQNGINSHLSGTYKYAIGEFSRAFREWPTYPLTSLLLGTAFIHLSCQKFHKTRHTSILHGLIFTFQYYHLRGGNQEACYNLARAFHSAGLIHFAVHYYNKALAFPLYNEKESRSSRVEYHPYVDLHREAAYNLSAIYLNSGNKDLAKNVLYKYCWV